MPSICDLERMIEEEEYEMRAHEGRMHSAEDVRAKFLFERLAALRSQGVATLQAYLTETRPSAEIVQQINDMFM